MTSYKISWFSACPVGFAFTVLVLFTLFNLFTEELLTHAAWIIRGCHILVVHSVYVLDPSDVSGCGLNSVPSIASTGVRFRVQSRATHWRPQKYDCQCCWMGLWKIGADCFFLLSFRNLSDDRGVASAELLFVNSTQARVLNCAWYKS